MRIRNLISASLLLALAGCGGGGSDSGAQSRPAKWTVMVYMNAANDLSAYDEFNVNQMERIAGSSNVKFVLQWKQARGWWDSEPTFLGTRRVEVLPDSKDAINSKTVQNMGTGVDMGDPQTLHDFVAWAKAYAPAQRYVLIIWNHGNGWRRNVPAPRGVSYDEQTGNSIDTWELDSAIGSNVDILAWDSSLMQQIEVNYEVRNRAKFICGSEESPPGEGYPYDLVFQSFVDTPDAPTATLARAFADGTMAYPPYATRRITQSVIDTSKLSAVATALSALGTQLTLEPPAVTTTARDSAYTYASNGDRYYYDLQDLCAQLDTAGASTALRARTADLTAAVRAAVVYNQANANSPRSTGLSVDFSPGDYFVSSGKADDYAHLKLGLDTQWNEWLTQAP